MAQHDMVIDNGTGAAVRTDINNALAAIASTHKGNARPATAYAGQLWLDDNTPSSTVWTLYLYDGADDIKLGEFNSTTNVFDASAAIGGARPSFSAHRNGTAQTGVAHNTFTKVQCGTEEWDSNANYDNATNFRFTPTVAGKYLIEGSVQVDSMAAGSTVVAAIYKNGSLYRSGITVNGSSSIRAAVSVIADANGSSDYFELFVFPFDGSAAARDVNGSSTFTRFAGNRLV